MKLIVKAVYYSIMFTCGFCVKEMLIYQPLHLELNILGLKFLILNLQISNSK